MNTQLDVLEAKIDRVVALVEQLRAENDALRQQIEQAEAERLHLRETMTAARERLEALVERLPEEA